MALILQDSNTNLATISKSQNNNLALFYEIQIYFGNYFTKPKILFWQKQLLYAQSPNVNSALILQNLNINLAPIS